MFRLSLSLRRTELALVAALALGVWPVAAEAGVISFRNETDFPIMVQGVSIINLVARRGRLHLLQPGEVVRELHLVPGTKLIIVADANQPARILCEKAIGFTGTDLFFGIQRDEPVKVKDGAAGSSNSKARKAVIPKVKLVPFLPIPPVPVSPSTPHR
jgi:hypothetical protein